MTRTPIKRNSYASARVATSFAELSLLWGEKPSVEAVTLLKATHDKIAKAHGEPRDGEED